jgi:hypothetical protein
LTPWPAAALRLEMGPLGRLYQRWRGADLWPIHTNDLFGGSQSSIYEGRRHFGPANVAKSYLPRVKATPWTLLHYLFVILFRSQHESSSGQSRRCVTKPWENRGPLRINVRLWSHCSMSYVLPMRERREPTLRLFRTGWEQSLIKNHRIWHWETSLQQPTYIQSSGHDRFGDATNGEAIMQRLRIGVVYISIRPE